MKVLFTLIGGLDLREPLATLRASVGDESILIEERATKGFREITVATFKIPMKNVISVIEATEKELAEISKSVVGRGIAGGLIFGPAGLLLGGMSGIGKKKGIKKSRVFIISFINSSGDISNITLEKHRHSNAPVTTKFQKYIQKELRKTNPSEKVVELRLQNEEEVSAEILL